MCKVFGMYFRVCGAVGGKTDFYSVVKDKASKLQDLPFATHLLVVSINNVLIYQTIIRPKDLVATTNK